MRARVARDPTDLNAHAQLAIQLDSLGLYDEALAAYRALADSGGTNWQLWYNMANVYKKTSQNVEAIRAYRESLALNPRNPDQLEVAAKIFDLVEPGDELVTLVDVTPVNRTRNFHNFSLETPQFFDDLYLRLVNLDMPRSRPEYRMETADGSAYWVLTRGR